MKVFSTTVITPTIMITTTTVITTAVTDIPPTAVITMEALIMVVTKNIPSTRVTSVIITVRFQIWLVLICLRLCCLLNEWCSTIIYHI